MAAVTGDQVARRALELADAQLDAGKSAQELVSAAGGERGPLEQARVALYDRVSRDPRAGDAVNKALLLLEAALTQVGWKADWASDKYVHKPWIR